MSHLKKTEEVDSMTDKEKAFEGVDFDVVKNGVKRGAYGVAKAAGATAVVAAGTYVGMRAYDKYARNLDSAEEDVVDFEDAQAQ